MNHEQRIEIRRGASFSAAEIGILKEQGAFVERINRAQRVFLPVGEEGLAAFKRITAAKPVVELFGERSPETGASAAAPEPDAIQARGLPSRALPGAPQKEAPGSATSRDAAALRAEPTAKASRPDPKAPYYEQVAAKLIEQLEAGTAPWQRPWEPGTIHLILRASRDADKISRYVPGLEKDRTLSSVEKIPEVARTQPQPAPARRPSRARAAGDCERG